MAASERFRTTRNRTRHVRGSAGSPSRPKLRRARAWVSTEARRLPLRSPPAVVMGHGAPIALLVFNDATNKEVTERRSLSFVLFLFIIGSKRKRVDPKINGCLTEILQSYRLWLLMWVEQCYGSIGSTWSMKFLQLQVAGVFEHPTTLVKT
ncbi:hypothetical protein EDB86DRAFT_988274 [Lactarius hatsudake]|nr:hypothetical protein EDB86DRAFT_988274 [Lactarius hatsudake]